MRGDTMRKYKDLTADEKDAVLSYRLWTDKKSFENFKKVYCNGFYNKGKGVFPLWRIWRILKDTVDGTYKGIANHYLPEQE